MNECLPKSENICRCESKKYYITGALWESQFNLSYEIGVRCKESAYFRLIQNINFSLSNIKRHCQYIKIMLDTEDLGLDAVVSIYEL
jgi:hypothetical protein